MVVAPVTVYGARSVTVSGSKLATQSVSSATLRLALLGKVMTVGDTVSLLPRDLGPGTSTSAATTALTSSVGITWTSELLTVTGVDPAGPVSVQPNSIVGWGDGALQRRRHRPQPSPAPDRPRAIPLDDLKGAHTQAGKLAEWLKLALDEPELLETLGATATSRRSGVRSRRCRQGHPGAGGVRAAPTRRTRRPRGRRAARRGPTGRAWPLRSPRSRTAAASC